MVVIAGSRCVHRDDGVAQVAERAVIVNGLVSTLLKLAPPDPDAIHKLSSIMEENCAMLMEALSRSPAFWQSAVWQRFIGGDEDVDNVNALCLCK